jgi:hypothetical protein
MSKLDQDLEKYADEAFNKHDVVAGLKLIGEISGMVALAGLAFTAITVWLPGLNIIIPMGVLGKGLSMAAKEYSNMDEKQRKQIRSVARLGREGIDGIVDFLSS